MATLDPRIVARMGRRARAYLSIVSVRHGLIGMSLLWLPWLYQGVSFVPVARLVPLWAWGGVMLVIAALCAVGARRRLGDVARAGMVLSAVVTLIAGAGVTIGVVVAWQTWIDTVGTSAAIDILWPPAGRVPADFPRAAVPPSPFLPLLLLAVAAKDFVVCAQPLRSPFAPELRFITASESGR